MQDMLCGAVDSRSQTVVMCTHPFEVRGRFEAAGEVSRLADSGTTRGALMKVLLSHPRSALNASDRPLLGFWTAMTKTLLPPLKSDTSRKALSG